MDYSILLAEQPREFLVGADEKTERIVRDAFEELTDDPSLGGGSGRGDREKITVDGGRMYRLHVGRTYTAFYTIHDEEEAVRVREVLPIDDAHKRYG